MDNPECYCCGSALEYHAPPVCDGCYESLARGQPEPKPMTAAERVARMIWLRTIGTRIGIKGEPT